jgi:hypothetical protein
MWLASTIVGLPLGLAGGSLANVAFQTGQVHRMGMALIGEGGAGTIMPSARMKFLIAGLVMAAAQLPFLAPGLASRGRDAALWLLGGVVAFGVGWLASATLMATSSEGTIAQGAVMGVISGAIDILVLLVLDRESRRPTSRSSRLGGLGLDWSLFGLLACRRVWESCPLPPGSLARGR